MVECLTRDRGAADLASLRCGPWARHIYPSLVLVQPRKTHPCLTERLLMGRKESNQIKNKKKSFLSYGHQASSFEGHQAQHFTNMFLSFITYSHLRPNYECLCIVIFSKTRFVPLNILGSVRSSIYRPGCVAGLLKSFLALMWVTCLEVGCHINWLQLIRSEGILLA